MGEVSIPAIRSPVVSPRFLHEGETMARWLRRQERPWREVLAGFRAAGEGLAAVHGAGLVHGDFKPDNVLISADGHFSRVRITDFGLARPAAAGPAPPRSAGDDPAGKGALTAAGGTPLYMAPEQTQGQPATALSDQYSFCVSLYIALCGRACNGSTGAAAGSGSSRAKR